MVSPVSILALSITRALPGVLALLVGVAGWFYLFYSRAAANLSGIEDAKLNSRRAHLRRFGAVVMLTLAVLIAVGSYGFDPEHPTAQFFMLWLVVIALLFMMMILGLIDVRLTYRLRRSMRRPGFPANKNQT